jgi:hypothetical protein
MTLLKNGLVIAGVLIGSASLHAGTIIWANDARMNDSHIEAFDGASGALLTSFEAPNAAAQGHIGRGIAVVGSSIFYSVDDSGAVFLTNPGGADLGIAFNTGLPGIGAIASDGLFLYLAPTGGSGAQNETVLKYTFGGALVSTTTLTPSTGPRAPLGRTGLEVVGTDFVANQGNNEGPYDKFDASGTLLTADFLHPGFFSFTGVAFDGSTYYVFDEEAVPSIFRRFDAAGNALSSVTLTCPGGLQRCDLQDLSTVATPEPSALYLLASVVGLAVLRRAAAARASRTGK